jgi:hypothetical protein
MKKVLILLVVAAGACATVVCQGEKKTPQFAIGREEVERYSPETKQKMLLRRCFRGSFESALQSLERGDSSLADAALRVHDASLSWSPSYLPALEETGKTPLERVARNLVDHFTDRVLTKPKIAHRVQELEAELTSLVSEIESASTGSRYAERTERGAIDDQ